MTQLRRCTKFNHHEDVTNIFIHCQYKEYSPVQSRPRAASCEPKANERHIQPLQEDFQGTASVQLGSARYLNGSQQEMYMGTDYRLADP